MAHIDKLLITYFGGKDNTAFSFWLTRSEKPNFFYSFAIVFELTWISTFCSSAEIFALFLWFHFKPHTGSPAVSSAKSSSISWPLCGRCRGPISSIPGRDDAAVAIGADLVADPDNLFLWHGGILLNICTKESNVPADFDWVMDNLAGFWDKDGDWVGVKPDPDYVWQTASGLFPDKNVVIVELLVDNPEDYTVTVAGVELLYNTALGVFNGEVDTPDAVEENLVISL